MHKKSISFISKLSRLWTKFILSLNLIFLTKHRYIQCDHLSFFIRVTIWAILVCRSFVSFLKEHQILFFSFPRAIFDFSLPGNILLQSRRSFFRSVYIFQISFRSLFFYTMINLNTPYTIWLMLILRLKHFEESSLKHFSYIQTSIFNFHFTNLLNLMETIKSS